jgi:hypothetical protein
MKSTTREAINRLGAKLLNYGYVQSSSIDQLLLFHHQRRIQEQQKEILALKQRIVMLQMKSYLRIV